MDCFVLDDQRMLSNNASNIDPNSDLKKIDELAFQWKMNFNPIPTKQV